MRHVFVGLLLILCMSFALTTSAEVVSVSGYGWSVSDLYGTFAGDSENWSLYSVQRGDNAVDVTTTKFPWVPGEIFVHDGGKLMDASQNYEFYTYFNVVNDGTNLDAILKMDFWLLNSLPLSGIYLNDTVQLLGPGDFGASYGAYVSTSIALNGSGGLGEGTHKLSFVVTPIPGSIFNSIVFGAAFDASIEPVPEPATVLLLGLSAAALPVVRRFRKN